VQTAGQRQQEDGEARSMDATASGQLESAGASPHFSAGAISVGPCAGASVPSMRRVRVPVPGSAQRSTAGGSPAAKGALFAARRLSA